MAAAENVKVMIEAVASGAVSPPAQVIDPSQPVPDRFDLQCESCGYSLVGLITERCPECGQRFDPGALPLARVPWLFRRSRGTLKAYFQTVWMIIRSPTAFAREMSRPVRICPADARSFRSATIWLTMCMATIASIALTIAVIGAIWYQMQSWDWLSFKELFNGAWTLLASMVSVWVFLWLATDLPTFIWRGLPANPKDLAPLHHYACAPLAIAPLILLAATAVGALWYVNGPPLDSAGSAAAAAFAGMLLLLPMLWWTPIRLMRGATGCGKSRQLLLGLYLPFHWLLIAIGAILLIGLLTMPLRY